MKDLGVVALEKGEGGDVCAYQDMLARVFERVHPACLVQHPLFPLSHKAYVLLKPNQSVPPACQGADPHHSTFYILYTVYTVHVNACLKLKGPSPAYLADGTATPGTGSNKTSAQCSIMHCSQ